MEMLGNKDQNTQQVAPKKPQHQKPLESYNVPDVDIDADKYENDEMIPF